jgi:hypothetical protein
LWKAPKEKAQRVLKEPCIDFGKAWGFFNRACQGTLCMCRAGGIIFFEVFFNILLKYAFGQVTKNHEKTHRSTIYYIQKDSYIHPPGWDLPTKETRSPTRDYHQSLVFHWFFLDQVSQKRLSDLTTYSYACYLSN